MDDDQRFAATRPDVLVYQTDVLTEDVTLAGPLAANLHVSTSGTDSDFVVKLIDVYSGDFPESRSRTRRASRWAAISSSSAASRCAASSATASKNRSRSSPGKTTAVNWTMPDVFHTFRRGHRIMIQVQSSWFPLVDRNPQNVLRYQHRDRGRFSEGDGARLPFAASRRRNYAWAS